MRTFDNFAERFYGKYTLIYLLPKKRIYLCDGKILAAARPVKAFFRSWRGYRSTGGGRQSIHMFWYIRLYETPGDMIPLTEEIWPDKVAAISLAEESYET